MSVRSLVWLCCTVSSSTKFLLRSCQDWRDLAKNSPWCLRVSGSLWDCGKISYISLRLPRCRWNCRDLAIMLISQISEIMAYFIHLAEIDKISPSLQLQRSHCDIWVFANLSSILPRPHRHFERHKHYSEITYISPRFRMNKNLTEILLQCKSGKILMGLWRIVVTKDQFQREWVIFLSWNKLLCGWPIAIYFSVRLSNVGSTKIKTFQHGSVILFYQTFTKVDGPRPHYLWQWIGMN